MEAQATPAPTANPVATAFRAEALQLEMHANALEVTHQQVPTPEVAAQVHAYRTLATRPRNKAATAGAAGEPPAIDELALSVARSAVEDVLIEWRDNRWSTAAGNGFVARERNGEESSVIRLSTRDGLRIGIRAYLAALDGGEQRTGQAQ